MMNGDKNRIDVRRAVGAPERQNCTGFRRDPTEVTYIRVCKDLLGSKGCNQAVRLVAGQINGRVAQNADVATNSALEQSPELRESVATLFRKKLASQLHLELEELIVGDARIAEGVGLLVRRGVKHAHVHPTNACESPGQSNRPVLAYSVLGGKPACELQGETLTRHEMAGYLIVQRPIKCHGVAGDKNILDVPIFALGGNASWQRRGLHEGEIADHFELDGQIEIANWDGLALDQQPTQNMQAVFCLTFDH